MIMYVCVYTHTHTHMPEYKAVESMMDGPQLIYCFSRWRREERPDHPPVMFDNIVILLYSK